MLVLVIFAITSTFLVLVILITSAILVLVIDLLYPLGEGDAVRCTVALLDRDDGSGGQSANRFIDDSLINVELLRDGFRWGPDSKTGRRLGTAFIKTGFVVSW